VNGIIIEFKALNYLNNDAVVQIKNYMKHYNSNQGLIINFNQKNSKLDIRFIYNEMIFTFENGTFTLNGGTL
jgi:GxxExxY protein